VVSGLVLTLILVLLYIVVVYALIVTGWFEKMNLSLFGPLVMWRTRKGRELIDRLSRAKRFWKVFASMSVGLTFILMALMFLLLIMNVLVLMAAPPQRTVDPRLFIGLPGINPIIPVYYGILGLAVAIIVHEFSHGILSRVYDIKLKSLGLLMFIFPVGAFVEPDEDQIMAAKSSHRAHIFAVGPGMNLVVCAIFALLFSWVFMASLEPASEGVFINAVELEYPADVAGIDPGVFILELNGTRVGTPAEFSEALELTEPGQSISVLVYDPAREVQSYHTVVLADKHQYYLDLRNESYPISDEQLNETLGVGFLGVNHLPLEAFRDIVARPVRSAESKSQAAANLIFYSISLPINGMVPFGSPFSDAFVVTGPLSALPTDLFWVLANSFYWIFWLNFLVGTFNTLPAVPLDGGYVLKDKLDGLFQWMQGKGLIRTPAAGPPIPGEIGPGTEGDAEVVEAVDLEEKLLRAQREGMVTRVVRFLSYSVLFMILWTLIFPYIAVGLGL